jgi:hypothetical protein
VEVPRDIDDILMHLLDRSSRDRDTSVLAPEDEAYLHALVAAARSGKRAIVIVEEGDERLRYMIANAGRAEAISMLGKVIESTGRRLVEGED